MERPLVGPASAGPGQAESPAYRGREATVEQPQVTTMRYRIDSQPPAITKVIKKPPTKPAEDQPWLTFDDLLQLAGGLRADQRDQTVPLQKILDLLDFGLTADQRCNALGKISASLKERLLISSTSGLVHLRS